MLFDPYGCLALCLQFDCCSQIISCMVVIGMLENDVNGGSDVVFEPVLMRKGAASGSGYEVSGDADDDVSWRLFIAVELPDVVASELISMGRRVGRRLRGDDRHPFVYPDEVRWTRRENLHITLKFLGDVDKDRICDVQDAMEEVARVCGVLNLALGSNGCFPGDRTPRALWTGIGGDVRRLRGMVTMLEGALARRGFEKATRDVMFHVTVARVRGGLRKDVLGEIGYRWMRSSVRSGRSASFGVGSIVLMRSILRHNSAPRYDRVFEVGLSD